MYTITILRSSPKSKTSFTDMLEPKRSKFGPKKAVNLNFPKKDHKNSFHTKNHQNFNESLKIHKLKC